MAVAVSCNSLFPSNSQYHLHPKLVFSSMKAAPVLRINRRKTISACLCLDKSHIASYYAKKAILLIGFGVLSIINRRKEEVEETTELSMEDQYPVPNPFLSLLSVPEVLGSRDLAKLFESVNVQIVASLAVIEFMKIELKKKEDCIHEMTNRITNLNSELQCKNGTLRNLEAEFISLRSAKKELETKLNAFLKEYNEFKSLAKEKFASNTKLLEERARKISNLNSQINLMFSEAELRDASFYDLRRDKNKFKGMLDVELENVKNLEVEVSKLSSELELAHSRISSLEGEQKQSSQEERNERKGLQKEDIN